MQASRIASTPKVENNDAKNRLFVTEGDDVMRWSIVMKIVRGLIGIDVGDRVFDRPHERERVRRRPHGQRLARVQPFVLGAVPATDAGATECRWRPAVRLNRGPSR